MKPSEIQQLQDLSKCYMPVRNRKHTRTRYENTFVFRWFMVSKQCPGYPMGKQDEEKLRRLTHRYANQIAAIKRNQRRANVAQF